MIQQIAPWFGYLASLLLIIALLVNNDLKFRWYNTFGNIAFITYAVILHAFPVLLTNSILIVINLFYLIKIYRKKENFDLLEFTGEEKLAARFLTFYQKDINAYFPYFKAAEIKGNLNFVVIRDLVIANIFSANLSPDGDAEVLINYTVQKYRDYKVGTFIFEKEKAYLVSKGIKRIVYKNISNTKHEKFLKVMGFHKGPDGYFVKLLKSS
ncbi:MAG: YgjV family protein [Ferruginibacter sp.]